MAWQPSKCCGCVPLRPGLLAWAYIKLVLILSLSGWLVFVTLEDYRHTLIMARYHGRPSLTILEILTLLLPFDFCLLTLVFTIIFIIGVQHKNYKLLLVFQVYSIIEVVSVTGYLGYRLFDAVMWLEYQYYGLAAYSTWYFFSTVVYILLSIYLIVLVKSEMQLLKKGGEEASAVLDTPLKKEQDRRYDMVYSNETPVRGKPLFPVEELERLRKQLGVRNV